MATATKTLIISVTAFMAPGTVTIVAETFNPSILVWLYRLDPPAVRPVYITVRGKRRRCGWEYVWGPLTCIDATEPQPSIIHTYTFPAPAALTSLYGFFSDHCDKLGATYTSVPFQVLIPTPTIQGTVTLLVGSGPITYVVEVDNPMVYNLLNAAGQAVSNVNARYMATTFGTIILTHQQLRDWGHPVPAADCIGIMVGTGTGNAGPSDFRMEAKIPHTPGIFEYGNAAYHPYDPLTFRPEPDISWTKVLSTPSSQPFTITEIGIGIANAPSSASIQIVLAHAFIPPLTIPGNFANQLAVAIKLKT